MDKFEEKYIKALSCAKTILDFYKSRDGYQYILPYMSEDLEGIFPELRNASKDNRAIIYHPNKEKRIKTCIGQALTCIHESLFTEFGTNLKECLEWLEKQGEPTEFHVGQVIVNKHTGKMSLIQFIENGCYLNSNREPICRIGDESNFLLYGKN